MKLFRYGLLVVALTTLSFSIGWAFSSLELYGGDVHHEILREALAPEKLSETSLYFIELGLVEPDLFYSAEFNQSTRHFTDMDHHESVKFMDDTLEMAVKLAGEAYVDYQAYRDSLKVLGNYFHLVQDFYAHTNWVEMAVLRGERPVPLVDFQEVEQIEGLVSPYFLYTALPPREVTNMAKYDRKFGPEFVSKEALEEMTSSQRIRYTAQARKRFAHFQLAKDNKKSAQGLLRTSGGETLFELAAEAARRDTLRQWNRLEERLGRVYGTRQARIASTLRSGWESNWPTGSDEATLSLVGGKLYLRRDLTMSVTLRFKPSEWTRSGARLMKEVYSDLTQREDTWERVHTRGLVGLSLVRQDESQTFEVSFKADLYGAQQSFVRMRPSDEDEPNGEWQAEFRLPDGLSVGEFPKIWVEGELMKSVGKRLQRVKAPAEGWRLPHWLDEYLDRL